MSLSWEKGKDGFAIAITTAAHSKLWNNKLLYCNPHGENSVKYKRLITEADISKVVGSRIKQRTTVIKRMHEALKNGEEYEDDVPKNAEAFEKLKNMMVESNTVVLPPDVKFEPLPLRPQDVKDGNLRNTLFISGMAGSGKTYLAKQYILLYAEMYPENKIFFISQQDKDNDPSLAEVRNLMTQISIEDIMDEREPITWESFIGKPCLVFGDDLDGFSTEKPKKGGISPMKAVMNIINDLLNNGRKFGVSLIISSHDLNKAHKNETILKECEYFCLYPQGIMLYTLDYFGRKYLGFSKEQIKEMKDNKSRWVIMRRKVPMIMLTEFDCKILK